MRARVPAAAALLALAAHLAPHLTIGPAAALTLREPPELAAQVAAGKLPPVAERLPADPLVVEPGPGQTLGKPGGVLRTLGGRPRDTRLLMWFGYSRLIGYDEKLALKPDIAEAIDVDDGQRVFTIHLRPGHKWSDGQPFTTEDFRYWWEDVANNKKLSPTGPPAQMLPQHKPPKVEVIDPVTIRYSWPVPNPTFLTNLAGTAPLFIYEPAHYLKAFHEKYADPKRLEASVKAGKARNWAQLYVRLNKFDRNDNPDLPTLDPWVVRTKPPSEEFRFARNAYFHRVDPTGLQLPYIDSWVMQVVDPKIVPVKAGAGETDLQARYIAFDNYTFLNDAADRVGFRVGLWRAARANHLTLYPDLTVKDPTWRALLRDVRFRRALSLGIDRHEINMVVFFGLGIETNNTALPGSDLAKPDYTSAWASYDPDRANALLGELGLKRALGGGMRVLPNGQPLTIVVETADPSTQQTDVLQLIQDTWRKLGIKLLVKPLQIENMEKRVFAGSTVMTIGPGADNGIPTPAMSPAEWAPTNELQLQWSRWANYFESEGKAGEPIDWPVAQTLLDLYRDWTVATAEPEQRRIWDRMLAINADQVLTIGLIAGVPQPVVTAQALRNVPETAMFNFDPGAFFGIYHPDLFWFDAGPTAARDQRTAGK